MDLQRNPAQHKHHHQPQQAQQQLHQIHQQQQQQLYQQLQYPPSSNLLATNNDLFSSEQEQFLQNIDCNDPQQFALNQKPSSFNFSTYRQQTQPSLQPHPQPSVQHQQLSMDPQQQFSGFSGTKSIRLHERIPNNLVDSAIDHAQIFQDQHQQFLLGQRLPIQLQQPHLQSPQIQPQLQKLQQQQPHLFHQQQHILTNHQQFIDVPQESSYSFDDLKSQLLTLLQRSKETEVSSKSIHNLQEELNIKRQNLSVSEQALRHFSSPQIDVVANSETKKFEQLKKKIDDDEKKLLGERTCLQNVLIDIHRVTTKVQKIILDVVLKNWHLDQQLASNGGKADSKLLGYIQELIDILVQVSWKLKTNLSNFLNLLYNYTYADFPFDQLIKLGHRMNQYLEQLIMRTFIVEKQPPQVMKTNTRIGASVRFLSGSILNSHYGSPQVDVVILSESNARSVIETHQQISLNNQKLVPPPDYGVQSATDLNQPSPYVNNLVLVDQVQSTINNAQFFNQQPQYQQTMNESDNNVMRPSQNNQRKTFDLKDVGTSGEILNSRNHFEQNETSKAIVCHFRNMQLKKIKRTEKKGTESVMDEKFILVFHFKFTLPETFFKDTINYNQESEDLVYHIMAFSLPVVVIVHGNQEPHAWATVTWHNAFARPDDILYQVPDKVSWNELGRVLSAKFETTVGKGLNEENLHYLAAKVSRSPVIDINTLMVTWSQFAKEPLHGRSFTFWEYFYSVLKLTSGYLRDLWRSDLIFGFLDRAATKKKLFGKYPYKDLKTGTFLMRFSDSELGGITIAWLAHEGSLTKEQLADKYTNCITIKNCEYIIMHLQPLVAKDLSTRKLADRICDLPNLVYLYPDLLKDEVFEPFCTRINRTKCSSKGYVPSYLVQTLEPNQLKANNGADDQSTSPSTPASSTYSPSDMTGCEASMDYM